MDEVDPFEAELAILHKMLGRPVNRERQAMARRAMAGRDPTLTPQEQLAVARRAAISAENDQAVEQGIGDLVLGQPIKAARAIGEAYQDPSIANVTNAGIQTALSVPTMRGIKTAAGIGAAGFGTAGLSDLGTFDIGANAQTASQSRARAAQANAEAAKARADADAQAAILKAQADAAAAAANTEAQRKANELAAKKAEDEQNEYNAAIQRAKLARDEILADRPPKFRETATGALYEKMGVAAPGVIGAATGLVTRGGLRAAGVANKIGLTAAPVATGTLAGGVGASWPLGHELIFQPPMNPERRAYEAYARELPPTHPRKEEWTNYAGKLPEANPARKVAADEFYDLEKAAERTGFGAAEGFLGGLMGAELPAFTYYAGKNTLNAMLGGGRKSAATMGAAGPAATPLAAQGSANVATPAAPLALTPDVYSRYTQLPASVRAPIQDAYLASRAIDGRQLPPTQGAKALQESLSNQNINVPVSAKRVQNTNEAFDAFVAEHGRLPTKKELSKIFNSKTLAIPASVVGGASILNPMLDDGQQ